MIERIDPRFDQIIPVDATLELVADGFTWVEGPVWDARGQRLLFSDIPRNVVMEWREGIAAKVFLSPSGYSGSAPFTGREPGSNGLALDSTGRLILCQHGDRRVARLEADGSLTTLADQYQGKRLNSPNDVVVRSNGDVYFTDPPFGLPNTFDDPGRELNRCGVYRITIDGTVTLLTDKVKAPNGLAFSPSGDRLYVSNADPADAYWLVFSVKRDGTLGEGKTFATANPWMPRRPGGPDGIKVDRLGNVFTAGPGGVYVFDPEGRHLGTILTGSATSNCAWGGDGSTLFITAGDSVFRIRTTTLPPAD